MLIEGASWYATTELAFEDPIDDAVRAFGLLCLQLYGPSQ
jgi:hypothetical protein